jgi:hypothetical protein
MDVVKKEKYNMERKHFKDYICEIMRKILNLEFLLLFLFLSLWIPTSAKADASVVLEKWAKEDRDKVATMGLNIYSINSFSKAEKALEFVKQLGRDKVLIDKPYWEKSYNILVPGELTVNSVGANPYGGSYIYRASSRMESRLNDSAFSGAEAAFNPLRSPSRARARR